MRRASCLARGRAEAIAEGGEGGRGASSIEGGVGGGGGNEALEWRLQEVDVDAAAAELCASWRTLKG